MHPIETDKVRITDETLKTLEHLGEERNIPPMLSCLHMGGFCFSNVYAYYAKHDKEPPKELEEFIQYYPKLLESLKDVIEEQYLILHSKGNA